MFTIGEFSKITGMTVKTLRFYHDRGLLVPARVERASGYRYYDHRNTETAQVISALRRLEFPLDEIALILEQCNEDGDMIAFLARHKDVLEERLAHYRSLSGHINHVITELSEQKEAEMVNRKTYEIQENEIPSQLIAGVRMRGRYSDCGKGFSLLGKKLGRFISGKAMCLMYDGEYREDDADFEPAFPIRKAVQAEGVDIRELAGSLCVTLVHQGPYDTLGRSYTRVLAHANDHGYSVVLPTREVYLKGPGMIFKGDPKKYRTEIQLPVAVKSS